MMKLTNAENFMSIAHLASINKIDMIQRNPLYPHVARVPLSDYELLFDKIIRGKQFSVLTYSNRGANYGPHCKVTKFGERLLPIVGEYQQNAYLTNQIPHLAINPKIQLLHEKLQGSYLNSIPVESSHFKANLDILIGSLKVQEKTSKFAHKIKSWDQAYKKSHRSLEEFINQVIFTTELFEVHTLSLHTNFFSGMETYAKVYGATTEFDTEFLNKASAPIIQKVWKNRGETKVIGILSKFEIDIYGVQTKRIFFFVRKKTTDNPNLDENKLFSTVEPFLQNNALNQIQWTIVPSLQHPTINFQIGENSNFYNTNQPHFSNKLDLLKSYLLGTDHWVRIHQNQTTLNIEKIPGEFDNYSAVE